MGENKEPQPGWTTAGEVVAVKDGDTVRVRLTREFDVRLLDCWAAESRRDPRIKSHCNAWRKK
jgi:hypothetical protein